MQIQSRTNIAGTFFQFIRKFYIFKIIFLVFLLGLAGCANKLAVTYKTNPDGASLYQDNKCIGYAPQTLYYKISDEDKQKGCKQIPSVTAKWVSGAAAQFSNTVNLKDQDITIERPENAAGKNIDIMYGLEREKIRILQAQAEAQKEAAMLQAQYLQEQTEELEKQNDSLKVMRDLLR